MVPDLSKDFPCRSFLHTRTEILLTTCYRTVYPLVLLYGIHKNDIIRIQSILREHSFGEDMSKLITSCLLNRDWTPCKVSFLSLFTYFEKKRRFWTTVSNSRLSLSSDLFDWRFSHLQKSPQYKNCEQSFIFLYDAYYLNKI